MGGYYLVNEYGGIDEIDKFGCCEHYQPFKDDLRILREIIKLQINLRISDSKKEKKIIN
jgi:hypothetical protein